MLVRHLLLGAIGTQALLIPTFEALNSFPAVLKSEYESLKLQTAFKNPSHDGLAPLLMAKKSLAGVPGRYIVVLDAEAKQEDVDDHMVWLESLSGKFASDMEAQYMATYGLSKSFESFSLDGLTGYTAFLDEARLKEVRSHSLVKFVEQDSVVTLSEYDVQKEGTWGLSRVSHRELAPSTSYYYDNEGGKGVDAYVIDTGIKTDHQEFEDRAAWGNSVAFPYFELDDHGHGTHCAGTIGSKTYGIAKNVNLVAVKVLNAFGSGITSDIIKGIEFVANSHKEAVSAKKKGYKGATINMSLGGGELQALDLAVNAATQAGVHVAVAAGNENEDACSGSPARATGPICVGATNNADEKASFSNWGSCVDIFAPGEDILSTFTWTETTIMSGTSMATPHVVGLLSYYASLYPEVDSEFSKTLVSPDLLKRRLIKYGTKGVITNLDKDSPNILAYNGAGGNLTDFWNL